MLESLSIENVAVIEKASITFEAGMTVLTGETGAGKSIIIDAINMALGERASKELIRTGAASATVTAVFSPEPNETIARLCQDAGIATEKGIVFERTITAEGRSVSKINGKSVTAAFLREIGTQLLNIHGQHDSQALLQSERHVEFLDALAGTEPLLLAYRQCYQQAVAQRQELSRLRMDEREKARRIDLLTFQINEIDDAQLRPGEDTELERQRLLMREASHISERLAVCLNLLVPEEGSGAVSSLGSAMHELSSLASLSPQMTKLAEQTGELYYGAQDLAGELRELSETLRFDPAEIEQIEQRFDLLLRLKNKYGETPEDILAYREQAAKELSSIELIDQTRIELTQRLEDTYRQLRELAANLSAARKKAAETVQKRVEQELYDLNLEKTTFLISVEPMREGLFDENGSDEVSFLISTNLGEEPRPLSKIVSGGELSRVMLALKSILGQKDKIQTAIFDEIDTGVSGSAAEKIGRKLKRLAADRQVLCITHLAQIAALADHHLLIKKSVEGDRTLTHVHELGPEGRIAELARLLSGETVTQAALFHAKQFLDKAASNL